MCVCPAGVRMYTGGVSGRGARCVCFGSILVSLCVCVCVWRCVAMCVTLLLSAAELVASHRERSKPLTLLELLVCFPSGSPVC